MIKFWNNEKLVYAQLLNSDGLVLGVKHQPIEEIKKLDPSLDCLEASFSDEHWENIWMWLSVLKFPMEAKQIILNLQKPPIEIEVFDGKFNCLVCDRGFVLGYRDKNLKLQQEDNCILCGQRYFYKSLGVWI